METCHIHLALSSLYMELTLPLVMKHHQFTLGLQAAAPPCGQQQQQQFVALL
jgi:hypothetical protein